MVKMQMAQLNYAEGRIFMIKNSAVKKNKIPKASLCYCSVFCFIKYVRHVPIYQGTPIFFFKWVKCSLVVWTLTPIY